MRIPEYKEQYRYTGSRGGGRIQAVHGGETFAGQQLEKVGNNIRGAGYAFMKAGNQIYQTEDYIAKAKATQMADEMKRAFMAKQTEYSKLKGENALNIDKDYDKFVAEQKQLAQRALGDNERALAYFNMSSADLEASQRHWVNGYRQGEEETYLDSVYESSLQTQQEMFTHNVNNPELMMQAKNQGFALIQEFCQRKGLGQETAKQLYKNFMTESFSNGVSALVAEGNLGRARTLLEHGKDYIGSDVYAKLKKGILDEQERLNEKYKVAKFNNQVNGIVGLGLNTITKNINTMSPEELELEIDKIATEQSAGNYKVYEKTSDMLTKFLNKEIEKKDNRVTVFGQRLLTMDGTDEQRLQLVNNAYENNEIDLATKNILDKTILHKDAKTTDYSSYYEIQDNIVKGTYKNYEEFLQASNNVQMTYEDRKALQKIYEKRNDPVIKQNNENRKEALKALNFNYAKPKSQSQSVSYALKEQENTSIFDYKIRQFERVNGRYPTIEDMFNINSQIINEDKFTETISDISEDFIEETGMNMHVGQSIEHAENLLISNGIEVTDENVIRLLQTKNKDLELANIQNGKIKKIHDVSLLDVEDIEYNK